MSQSKVAVITGSSRGIGATCASYLAEKGYLIVITYKDSKKQAQKVLKEINKISKGSLVIKLDVTKRQSVELVFNRVLKKFGQIDVLINNAGVVFEPAGWEEVSSQDFLATLEVNLSGVFNCIRIVAPMMKTRKMGVIVNISSLAGVYGSLKAPAYSAAKAGVILLTKAFAKELASDNIRVNAVAPSWVRTSWHRNKSKKFFKMVNKSIPIGRIAEAEDVAAVVNFLVSEESRYITGQTIIVDGGASLR